MPSLADVVREHAPAYVARHGESMPMAHLRALHAIIDCRTSALGAELAACDDCGTTHLVFHSCRHRACPRCGHDSTTRWIDRQTNALLPAPYFHVVFTLPAELRRLVRSNQRVLLDVLFRAAFESLTALAADPRYLGARLGALAVLHTWTRTLEWHPHVHMLVPGGGLAPNGRTWKTVKRRGRADFLVPVRALAKHFRGRFLHLARRALPGVPFPKIPWNKPWIVYAKRSVDDKPDRLLEYLARYVHRTALSDKRIVDANPETVTFAYRDSATHKRKVMTLGGHEFLRRFLQHVPPKGFHRVRAYGLLHPRNRLALKRLQLLLDAPPPEPAIDRDLAKPKSEPATPRSAALRCPQCQSGAVRIVARLSSAEAIEAERRLVLTIRPRAPP